LKISVRTIDKTGTKKTVYIQVHSMSSFTLAEIADTDVAE